jgi:hypothetical protein
MESLSNSVRSIAARLGDSAEFWDTDVAAEVRRVKMVCREDFFATKKMWKDKIFKIKEGFIKMM